MGTMVRIPLEYIKPLLVTSLLLSGFVLLIQIHSVSNTQDEATATIKATVSRRGTTTLPDSLSALQPSLSLQPWLSSQQDPPCPLAQVEPPQAHPQGHWISGRTNTTRYWTWQQPPQITCRQSPPPPLSNPIPNMEDNLEAISRVVYDTYTTHLSLPPPAPASANNTPPVVTHVPRMNQYGSISSLLDSSASFISDENNIMTTARATTNNQQQQSPPQSLSLVLYGSSHLREVLFALLRLQLGMAWDATLNRTLSFLPSGYNFQNAECDPNHSGFVQGLFGVDLTKCGLPARRRVTELGHDVVYGFKTFLHTPDADAQFLQYLQTQGPTLRHPTILIVDVGIWGLRGSKRGGSAQTTYTPQQELDYYLQWLVQSFPSSHILILYESTSSPTTLTSITNGLARFVTSNKRETRQQQRISIYRKDLLQDPSKRPPGMSCGHGCSGPVVNTISLQIVEWLQRLRIAVDNSY